MSATYGLGKLGAYKKLHGDILCLSLVMKVWIESI